VGANDRRPGLDDLVRDARRRKFDAVVVWKLDRLGRSLRHLVLLMEELQQLGVALVSLGEGLDLSTAAGRLQAGLLAAVAQFERERIRKRVVSGLQRAKAQGNRGPIALVARQPHRRRPARNESHLTVFCLCRRYRRIMNGNWAKNHRGLFAC